MGTRSVTVVFDNREAYSPQPVASIYRQHDGRPEDHGAELAAFLTSGRLVNGLRGDEGRVFNGAGCLAAQLVCELKQGNLTEPKAGGIYLIPTNQHDAGQDYEYHVFVPFGPGALGDDDGIVVRVYSGANRDKTLFRGSVADFADFCEEQA